MTGKVYIVGAGPGDPALITVKGQQLLEQADIVIYDRLVSADLLATARKAEGIYMGKEPNTPGAFQRMINETLVASAREGKMVVRLKGGDPFVFGRGGEEAQALTAAGIPYEVVPGITSAIAVPSSAGIPITHRGVAASFTVVTGSEDPGKPESLLDWPALARLPGTLVVLMGWHSLPAIVDALTAGGRPIDTPVSITQWGTLPGQRTVDGTLADIIRLGNEAGLASPVVTVIGPVVSLRPGIRWLEKGAFSGKRILVTRSRAQASTLRHLITDEGAEVIELPAIAIQPVADPSLLDDALRSVESFRWVVFSSSNAVEAVFTRLAAIGRDARALGPCLIAAIGPATAASLARYGITADLVPSTYTASTLALAFKDKVDNGTRVLLPRADVATNTLPNGLRELGANLTEIEAYKTITPLSESERAKEALSSGTIDAITFTSSSTVRGLVNLVSGDTSLVNATRVVSIGPVTTKTADELGVRIDAEASEHTVPGVVRALRDLVGHG